MLTVFSLYVPYLITLHCLVLPSSSPLVCSLPWPPFCHASCPTLHCPDHSHYRLTCLAHLQRPLAIYSHFSNFLVFLFYHFSSLPFCFLFLSSFLDYIFPSSILFTSFHFLPFCFISLLIFLKHFPPRLTG